MEVDGDPVVDEPTLLKALLRVRHWQKRETFSRQWDKIAKELDSSLVGTCPAHAQFYRWLRGNVRGIPHPDACRILEEMFPRFTIQQLFQPVQAHRSELREPTQAQLAKATGCADFSNIPSMLIQKMKDPGPHDESGWSRNRGVATGFTTQPEPSSIRYDKNSPARTEAGFFDNPLGKKLILLAQRLRMSATEVKSLARLVGQVVELDTVINVNIPANGHSVVEYDRLIVNLTSHPISRLSWDVWFKHAHASVTIAPGESNGRKMRIATIHETVNLAKFATLLSPPVDPGDTARMTYSCHGGLFTDSLYWRQDIPHCTRHFTLTVRHRIPRKLVAHTATEEFPDGSERSATEGLIWDTTNECHTLRVTRDYLERGQKVTVKWEIEQ
ncbi:MAG: hypothetical protein ACRDRS_06410 [Pseudonocardiaceae bacterium]